ncbi:MAG: hypothetical protein IJ377_01350 [Rikenellaceae bacterium]|nr:hypothetical protein [Rikenellaceae bacterium]
MEYKRKQRALSDATKQKISAKLKGRKKPLSVCTKISRSLENYWSQIPQQQTGTTINDPM